MPNLFAPRAAALLLSALLPLAYTPAAHAQPGSGQPQASLPVTKLSAGIHVINAEVASTPGQRQTGLMYRPPLPANDGMLFVFEAPDMQCFWMHNTPSPLSAAFIADDGVIVNIEDMAPETDDSHCSRKPVRYVLEMAQGWFASKGIKAGNRIDGLP
jgi:hypothetical protein